METSETDITRRGFLIAALAASAAATVTGVVVAQQEDQHMDIQRIGSKPSGNVVWFPPGEKHWHGVTATTAMTHIAIQEKFDGSPVTWTEKVTDEQYRK